MKNRVLTRRDLNRMLLHRQMLLARQPMTIPQAVERLLGLQAQVPNPPYIGLWTRLEEFRRDDLTHLIEQRQIVRAALMRSTLHLMTASDHQQFRRTLQPALTRALSAFFGQRAKGIDVDLLVQTAQEFINEQPRTTGELRSRLLQIAPERDGDAMAYAVRVFLPLIQVAPGGTWGSGSAAYTTAESWLGPVNSLDNLRALFFRYLAAFGPASIMDFQTWSGMTRLQTALEAFRPELKTYQDERGKLLFDLHDAPAPEDAAPPVRFIPEYDNLLLSHADRTRVIADEHRPKVFLSAGRVQPTFLIDGFVSGAWKIEKAGGNATLEIDPFVRLSAQDRDALADEGERLIRFVEGRAAEYQVQFAQ